MGKKKAPTRKSSRGFRGRSHSKQVKPLVVLAVEGATEKQYLNALNQHLYGRAFSFTFCRNDSKSSLKNLVEIMGGKVKELERESISISGAWIICDADVNQPHRAILKKWLSEKMDFHHVQHCRIPASRRGLSITVRTSVRAGPQVPSLRNSSVSGNGELMRKQWKFLSGSSITPTRPVYGCSVGGRASRRA